MKLILAGDLHIGRASTRLPEEADRGAAWAVGAWERIVELALREKVCAVCLSGDVADQENQFWEAIGPLERGVAKLADAGIRVIAVSGNHDFDVLARLADLFDPERFLLLGRGGRWESVVLEEDGRPALRVDGWSFDRRRVEVSPLEKYDFPPDPSLPILGMVHGDLGAPGSPYAPLDAARLWALPPAAWLLGHLHAPRLMNHSAGGWALYPGSPQALDPGETGPHGAWTLETTDRALPAPEPAPLSSAWYETVEIEVGDAAGEGAIETLIINALRDHARRIERDGGGVVRQAVIRVVVKGVAPLAWNVARVANELVKDLSLPLGDGSLTIESMDVRTLPPIDLEEQAKNHTAPGALARLALELEGADVSPETAELIREAREELTRVGADRVFAFVERSEAGEQQARDILKKQCFALLNELLRQNA